MSCCSLCQKEEEVALACLVVGFVRKKRKWDLHVLLWALSERRDSDSVWLRFGSSEKYNSSILPLTRGPSLESEVNSLDRDLVTFFSIQSFIYFLIHKKGNEKLFYTTFFFL